MMKMTEQKLGAIKDPLLISMIQELSVATKVHAREDAMLWSFLTQCLYPFGSDQRYKLDKNDFNPVGLLMIKIGKLKDTAIWDLCDEIARKHNQSAELYLNTSLYLFFNKHLPDFGKKPKKYKFHPRDVGRLLGDQGDK